MVRENDVVQFTESHKWCGCLGIVDEVRSDRIMVGVPMPSNDSKASTAYVFCKESDFEVIGQAVMVLADN